MGVPQEEQQVQRSLVGMLLNSGLVFVAQEVCTDRHVLGKRKDALLGKPAILGRRWTHVPKNQLPVASWWSRAPRGQFQGCIDAGGRPRVEQLSQL